MSLRGWLVIGCALLAAAACLRPAEAGAASEPKDVSSKVRQVTVYPEWASVTREAKVDLAAGINKLAVKGLPAWIDDDSIRAKLDGAEGLKLISVSTRTVYLARSTKEEVRKAEDEVTALRDKIVDLQSEMSALTQEKRYLAELSVWKIEKTPQDAAVREVKLSELREAKDFIREEMLNNLKRSNDIERKVRDLKPQLEAKEKACDELRVRARLEQKEIAVEIEAAAAAKATLAVTYLISGASWYPSYDARTSSGVGKVDFTCEAIIQQSTGEDWADAKFTLSTIQPYLVREKPELKPVYIDSTSADQTLRYKLGRAAAMQQLAQKQLDYNENDSKAQQAFELYRANAFMAQEVVRSLEDRGTTVEFEIAGTYSVAADGKPVKMAVGQAELDATRRYTAVPAVSKSTYVTGEMRNSGSITFLPGPVTVYVDGTFIGKSKTDCVAQGEKFELYLGLEEGIKVTRELDAKNSSVSRSGSSKRMKANWRIEVKNFLKTAATVEVSDQVPVSQDTRVKVKLMTVEPKTAEPERGIIAWKLELQPGEAKELRYDFQVDYPVELVATPQPEPAGGRFAPQQDAAAPAASKSSFYEMERMIEAKK